MRKSMRCLLIEDEMLLMMQLEDYIAEAGHVVVGTAIWSREALDTARAVHADLALVDIHLADGPTGIDVGRSIAEQFNISVVFMTANPKRLPEDFSGAIGVIAKPYTQEGLFAALEYLVDALFESPSPRSLPRSLVLSPAYANR